MKKEGKRLSAQKVWDWNDEIVKGEIQKIDDENMIYCESDNWAPGLDLNDEDKDDGDDTDHTANIMSSFRNGTQDNYGY